MHFNGYLDNFWVNIFFIGWLDLKCTNAPSIQNNSAPTAVDGNQPKIISAQQNSTSSLLHDAFVSSKGKSREAEILLTRAAILSGWRYLNANDIALIWPDELGGGLISSHFANPLEKLPVKIFAADESLIEAQLMIWWNWKPCAVTIRPEAIFIAPAAGVTLNLRHEKSDIPVLHPCGFHPPAFLRATSCSSSARPVTMPSAAAGLAAATRSVEHAANHRRRAADVRPVWLHDDAVPVGLGRERGHAGDGSLLRGHGHHGQMDAG